MAIHGVDTKCYILALFVRDDGERFLLGSGHYEFKDTQMHFAANAIQNDIVEVQGNDGFLLAGQVRRPGTQSFDGYVGDGTLSKQDTEAYRRQFFSFFRKNFFYKVIYVFSDGTAIQRKRGFLVDDPTVQELYQIYPEYHVALNFEDVNYYSYSEDDEGHEQYAEEATIDLSSMRATGGLEWDNLGIIWEAMQWGGEQSVSGTELTIQNNLDIMVPAKDEKIEGDTEQQTYSGKNKIGLTPYYTGGNIYNREPGEVFPNTTSSNVVISNQTNSSITFTSTVSNAGILEVSSPLSEGEAYVLSASLTASGSIRTTAYTLNSSHEIVRRIGNTTTSLLRATVTMQSGELYIAYAARGNESNYTFTIDNLQLETGSTVTDFEPYVGGIPAPSPDYPQDIHVVAGEQTVTVTGKNLFNNNTVALGKNWNGGIDTTCYPYQTQATRAVILVPVKPNTTYNLSLFESDWYVMQVLQADSSYKVIADQSTGTFNEGIKTIATLPDTAYIGIKFKYGSAGTTTMVESLLAELKLQLEAGSPTTYEPYTSQTFTLNLGTTELCKLGDYQDYIYKGTDGWYVHKAIGKITYTGNSSENWQYSSTSSGPFRIAIPNSKYFTSTNVAPLVYCDYYTPVVWNSITSYNYAVTAFNNNVLPFRNTDITSLDAWKAWLGSHNMTVYYPFATSSDTKITDATLISQLNKLGSMKLFVGENNLSVLPSTNLPASLSFKYYTTVETTGSGAIWEEGGSGGATVVEVDSITNVYPIWKVKGPVINPELSVITTNTTLQYNGTITGTQTLEVDMFNKTAKLNGVSVIGNISGDWVNFLPGTNRVIYTADNADALPSTIEWQEVVG